MFATGVNSTHDGSGGNGGSLLVPARFVWPHGGKRVSLIGSFTRWQEHLAMTPVEGCPTVFQAIFRLTPGIHQYKFIVDGEWRHDDHQPFVAGSYGIVNTMDLSRGSTPLSAISNSESSSTVGMNMEVDPVNFDRVVHVSLPHNVLEVSRRCVLEFLSNHTTYDIIPDSGKVIMLDVNLPVKQAFHILHEQGLSVAPLWDSYKGQFVGMLSALDFILILRELGSRGSNLTEEELETHSIYAWKEGKRHMVANGLVDSQGRPYPRHLIHASPYDSLQEVALKIRNHAVATVPILYSSNEDGSFPQLLHLASLCGILRCICRHFRHSSSSLPILCQQISELGLGSWVRPAGNSIPKPILTLRPNDSLGSALNLLVDARVSCLPIVDDNNSLLEIYSRSDITALAKDRAYTKVHLAETTVQQALQLGHGDGSSQLGFCNQQRCQMCLPTDNLLKVMEKLSIPGVRRVLVIEAGTKRVEAIISLSDVFNFLIPPET